MEKIVGIESVDYTSRKTNRRVVGFKLHTLLKEENRTNVNGYRVNSFFVSEDVFRNYFDLPLGSEVEVYYNQYGTPCGCTVLERSKEK